MSYLVLGRLRLGNWNPVFNKMGCVPSKFLGLDTVAIIVIYFLSASWVPVMDLGGSRGSRGFKP